MNVDSVSAARRRDRRHGPVREKALQLRGQRTDRTGGSVREALHGQDREEPTPQEPSTRYYDLDDDSVPELGGSLPDQLFAVLVRRSGYSGTHVEQINDTALGLPILDVPVPLMVEQPAEVLHFFDTFSPVAEQVINVPKIVLEDIPMRALAREPLLVEQLVEMPNRRLTL